MPKLTETFARKLPQSKTGTEKHWDSEVRGLCLFVGKRSKTWYFQKDVGGQTKRIMIGRFPVISAQAARQTAMELALEMGRGAGKVAQIGAPTLEAALEGYLGRPKLRSDAHKRSLRKQFELHLKEWLKLPLDEISKKMVVEKHQSMAATPSAANHMLKYFRTIWNHARRVYDLPKRRRWRSSGLMSSQRDRSLRISASGATRSMVSQIPSIRSSMSSYSSQVCVRVRRLP